MVASGTEATYLYRYPRELPKPKCVVEDVEVEWHDGYMSIDRTSVHAGVGSWIRYKNASWQIAEFLFEETDFCATVPIITYDQKFIRANRVRLVRWEND
jgi:hypothetical protein